LYEITVTDRGGSTVVVLRGEIDLAANSDLWWALQGINGDVAVDLSAVSFLDSTGIGTLTSAGIRLEKAGGSLRFCDPPPFVRRRLETIGLANWIDAG
jgi:anti-anti-sigma factor